MFSVQFYIFYDKAAGFVFVSAHLDLQSLPVGAVEPQESISVLIQYSRLAQLFLGFNLFERRQRQ